MREARSDGIQRLHSRVGLRDLHAGRWTKSWTCSRRFPPCRSVPCSGRSSTSTSRWRTSIHTEKARSEFIVAPILAEVRKLMNHRISLFSGVDFNVDPAQGLNGTCDFILAASPVQLFLQRPVVMIVEAKNDNIKSGLGQCVAEMVAARLFNERQGDGPSTIHGAVTTGSIWRFLKLDGATVFIDQPEYYLDRAGKNPGHPPALRRRRPGDGRRGGLSIRVIERR